MTNTPVLIVGAGPVGLVAATALAHHGVACILTDSSPLPTRYPKMDITNGRSMELLRQLRVADELRAAGVASHHHFDVVFATGLSPTAVEIGRWDLPSVDDARNIIRYVNDGTQPLEPAQRCQQSVFEALLRERCEREPLIDCRWGWTFESLVQGAHDRDDEDDDDADDIARFVTSTFAVGDDRRTVSSDYVIGCDGASSAVRREVNLELEGPGGVGDLVMVHFRSHDDDHLQRFGRFWHVYFPGGGVIIAQDEVDHFTAHCPVRTPDDIDGDPVALVQRTVGAPIAIDEVLLRSRWSPRLLLADRYRHNRVFLAGDSAHQVIPTGGYGMNTGLGDAVDVAWKLAAVIHGWGGTQLLDSYEIERRPVGRANLERSARHGAVIMQWGGAAAALTNAGGATGELDPIGRGELASFLEDERGENESFGIELDARYRDSPIVCADDAPEPPWDPMRVHPSTWPGCRAPSVILQDGSAILDHLGSAFVLFDLRNPDERSTSGALDGWTEAARAHQMPFAIVAVDEPAVRSIYERALVLVRPDGYVAWRCGSDIDASHVRDAALIDHILDRVSGKAAGPAVVVDAAPVR